MSMLGIDVGSSSIKAALLEGRRIVDQAYVPYPSRHDTVHAEVRAQDLLKAVADGIAHLGRRAREVDWINFATMAPSWVAMDRRGKALTPIVTHQDRRSVRQAHELEKRIGRKRLLKLAGNRPFPGGISSTTALWFFQEQPDLAKKADLVGHVSTLLIRQLTGARRMDPSNASFTGLFRTLKLDGWSEELCDAAKTPMRLLPEIADSDCVAGTVTADAARRFHLRQGTPVLSGMMDGSGAFFLTDLQPGQMVNVCGSTDVVAVLGVDPRPSERLLTRPLGVGRRWLSVSTLAASGSTLHWMRDRFFADWSDETYWKRIRSLARVKRLPDSQVQFEPYLAGDRMKIDQRHATLGNLSLATTREDILHGVVRTLVAASAQRLEHLQDSGQPIHPRVLVTGGEREGMDKLLRRDWPHSWRYRNEQDATVRGLGVLSPRS